MSETCIHCQSWRDDCNEYLTSIDTLRTELKEAREEVDRLRKALEHYAEEKLYFPRSIIRLCNEKGIRVAPIYSDFGEVAQQALNDIGTEDDKGRKE
jgi:ppGpp synthetase/RelA/SpoT-type nucleotidyltranferase